MSEEYDLALEEWLGVLAELWTAAWKPLEADRLQVYRQSLEEVSLGLLVTAVEADAGGHDGESITDLVLNTKGTATCPTCASAARPGPPVLALQAQADMIE